MKGADEAQAARSAKIKEGEVAITPEEMHKLAGLQRETLTDSPFHCKRAGGTPAREAEPTPDSGPQSRKSTGSFLTSRTHLVSIEIVGEHMITGTVRENVILGPGE
jgi:hypothetical protein